MSRTLWVKLTAIFFDGICAIASGVIPSSCSRTSADSTRSSRPTGQRHKRCRQIVFLTPHHRKSFPTLLHPQGYRLCLAFYALSFLPQRFLSLKRKTIFWSKKKVYFTGYSMFYHTCQCPNFNENFWSPGIDWTKSLRSWQTARQSLHLLLCARKGSSPQERHSHAAVIRKWFRTQSSSEGMQNVFICAAEKCALAFC